MTEQELRQQLIKAAYEWSISSGDESIPDVVMPICKAYADAQVEASVGRQQPIFEAAMNAKNTEIAELKAQLDRASEVYADLVMGTTETIQGQQAEIKRLREFAQQCQKSPEKLVKMNWFEDGSFDYCDLVPLQDAAAIALSPAPVTEGPKKTFSLQMYECNRCEWYGQVGESIETESYDVCPKCLSEDLTLLDSPKNEDQHE